jgi:hypothetical protein
MMNCEESEAFVFYSGKLETKSVEENGVKRYFVRGYISTGDMDLVNDIVTKSCRDDIHEQFLTRDIKLDFEHETLRKGKDESELDMRISLTKVPLGKEIKANIDEKGNFVEFELNPDWKKFDSKGNVVKTFHEVWREIKSQFLDAFSIAYIPIKTQAKNINGVMTRLLDKINIVNIALTGNPINPKASMESAFTKSLEYLKTREGETMEPELKNELEVLKKSVDELKLANGKLEAKLKAMEEEETDEEKKKKKEEEKKKEMEGKALIAEKIAILEKDNAEMKAFLEKAQFKSNGAENKANNAQPVTSKGPLDLIYNKRVKNMTDAGSDRIPQGFDNKSAYAHSFGPLSDHTVYRNGWAGIDYLPQLKSAMEVGFTRIMQKALGPTTGGAGTAGYALVPVYVDPRIVDVSRKYTPAVEMIPRVTNQGLTADYNRITAKGGAYSAAPDAALPETNDTYERKSTSIKFIYSIGRVLGPMQAAMPSYILEGFQPSGAGNMAGDVFSPAGAPNAKQTEVLVKARSIKEYEENLIFNGSVSTLATDYDGLEIIQSTTNVTDLSGAALTWDDIENSIETAFSSGGRPKIAFGSGKVISDVRKIMIDALRIPANELSKGADLPYGILPSVVLQTMVGPIPLIPSMFLTNTAGSKKLWFVDTDFVEMRVLQDMTYEDLAHSNDSAKFMLKIYECLINRAPQFCSFIKNIG